jgi:RNA polymerase sigma-70 factor (ECF subfamily)
VERRSERGPELVGRRTTTATNESTPAATSDAELAMRAIQDPQAFSLIFERYHRDIFLYCLRRLGHPQDADDATSTVFLKAFSAIGSFRPRGEGSGATFRSWMFAIAHNVVVDTRRKPARTVSLDSPDGSVVAGRIPAADLSPEHLAIRSEEARTVLTLLNQLPEHQRSVVELRLAGLSIKEIANALGMSVAATKSNQFRGYRRLRDLLETDATGVLRQELTS